MNPYGYVHNPLMWIDPFGLTPVNAPGYHVYGLYDPEATKPYYIGITNDIKRRSLEHMKTGRLSSSDQMRVLDRNVTYGQARGYEQYYIEKFNTKTGIRGQDISGINRGNKINSFDHSRMDPRAKIFEESYKLKKGAK